jgi:hypothetical protein
MSYKNKYLKYKSKYISLKNLIGGNGDEKKEIYKEKISSINDIKIEDIKKTPNNLFTYDLNGFNIYISPLKYTELEKKRLRGSKLCIL